MNSRDISCTDDELCIHLHRQIVPMEKAGFVKWEKVMNGKVQLCGVGYKKAKDSVPFLITVCPFCGVHPGIEFPLKKIGATT